MRLNEIWNLCSQLSYSSNDVFFIDKQIILLSYALSRFSCGKNLEMYTLGLNFFFTPIIANCCFNCAELYALAKKS